MVKGLGENYSKREQKLLSILINFWDRNLFPFVPMF